MNTPLHSTSGVARLQALIREQKKIQAWNLASASVTAAIVSASAVLLLGLSGWFITAAALAGLGGPIMARTFNFLIPSSMIRLLAIVRTASRYGERMTGHSAALHALAGLRPRLFEGLARGPVTRTLGLSGGEAAARLVQDVDAVQNHFVRQSAPWGAISGLVAGLGMALLAGWRVVLAVLITALINVGVCALIGRRLATPAGHEVQRTSGALKSEFAAMAAAAPELQAYGVRDWAVAKVVRRGQDLDQAQRRMALAGSSMVSAQGLAMALAVIAVALTGPAAAPPLMALAFLAAITTIESSGTLMQALHQQGAVKAALGRLGELLDGVPVPEGRPASYRLSLSALGLEAAPPDRIAITGRSGAGKTTLVERWMLLRPAVPGETFVGGSDLVDLDPDAVRAGFAYAPQQAVLLAGSIRANLHLAAPTASDDLLWQALETADLATRIRQSPQGLDSPLGENGAHLSGGERRRLGLARAYLRAAPWLILDEPTEGLDAATETRVLHRLEQHLTRTGQGLILISHRPGPLALCHKTIRVGGLVSDRVQLVMERPGLIAC